MNKKLYRSRKDSQIAGVCGGLGNYFGVDSTWVRIFFVVMAFTEGFGLFVYVILSLIVPRVAEGVEELKNESFPELNFNASKVAGIALVVVGAFAIFWNFFPGIFSVIADNFWGAAFILLGGAMLYKTKNKGEENE